jgi:hypothetical protein
MAARLIRLGYRASSISLSVPVASFLFLAAVPSALGQSFPTAPSNQSEPSLGRFQITVAPAFRSLFPTDTPPGFGYNPTTHVLSSPLLNDSDTMLGESATVAGGFNPTPGSTTVTVGAGGSAVSVTNNSTFYPLVPSTFSSAKPGTDEIFTQIQSFDLTNGTGTNVLAGSAAPLAAAGSYGQVQTETGATGGVPTNMDFPARSFFDVFVEIQVPLPSGSVDLYNPLADPLLVQADGLTALPPKVVYIHNKSSAVPIVISGGPFNGDTFGTLDLAGHGVGYSINNPADVMSFNDQYAQAGGTVPESSTWAMMLLGFVGIGYLGYRRTMKTASAGALA